ncbi:MAG: hypothetical protein J6A28_04005 [Clostridia bacterium]|nr:hypothetical protein [Clostridia bacterium]
MGFEKVDLSTCPRADAFDMFKDAPNPTIALTSKFDVTPLVKLQKKGWSFNCMMMYCILKACKKFEGCWYDIKKGELVKYDWMCIDMIVQGKDGKLYYVDMPDLDNFPDFHEEYIKVRSHCRDNCQNRKFLGRDHACISTSAVVNREFEAVIPNYFRDFFNPFFLWGKVHRAGLKKTLNISLRVHHSFMDGQEVGEIFNQIQYNMTSLKQEIKESLLSRHDEGKTKE